MATATHEVAVEGVGTFVFRRRTFRDQLRIEAEALRILGGPTSDPKLDTIALSISTLSVLTVTAPAEWNVEEFDPFDPGASELLLKVYGGLRLAEDTFRGRAAAAG